jgi:hypothetical protein
MRGRIVAAVWLMLAAFIAPTRGHADCKLGQIAEFHTSPGVGAPIIDGAINGKPVKVQISTSSVSQIPLHEARLLGLLVTEVRGSHWYDHVAGVTQGYVAHVRLKIGDVESADLELPVTGDPRTPSRFSLVLGSDFFSQVDTEYDLPHNAIRLFKPQGCTPPQLVYWGAAYSQASIGPWRRDSPDIETEASLNGKKVRATLEAADEWSMMDPLTAEADGVRWPPRDAVAGPRIINDFGPVSEDSRIGLFDSFALGDERISNVRLLVARFDRLDWYVPRLWIGADYFRAHRIYIDVRDRLMLFSYAGGKIFDADASRGK